MSELRISVIVPTHNAVQFIEQTLQSVVNQDYSNFECVVIDGGSNDGTLDILEEYQGKIRWISERDEGQSDAINKGIKLAGGDVIGYICADDVYETGCFEKIADFFDHNPDVMWVCGKCKIMDKDGLEIRRPVTWYKNFLEKRYSYNKLLIADFIAQPAVFWRKELVEEIGLFDTSENLAMDYEYWLRAAARHHPGFINEYLARFRVHRHSKSSVSHSRQAKDALRIAGEYATSSKRRFLMPLQYLNYLSVLFYYFVLNLFPPLRTRQ